MENAKRRIRFSRCKYQQFRSRFTALVILFTRENNEVKNFSREGIKKNKIQDSLKFLEDSCGLCDNHRYILGSFFFFLASRAIKKCYMIVFEIIKTTVV